MYCGIYLQKEYRNRNTGGKLKSTFNCFIGYVVHTYAHTIYMYILYCVYIYRSLH